MQIKPRQWLIVAAICHVVATLTVFLIGHFRFLPKTFDEHGIGVSFAIDGVVYRELISDMARTLQDFGLSAWLDIQGPLHCRLYSLAFLFPGRLLGYNILAAEPLNLLYFLGLLFVAYLIGKEIFDSRTGFVAAVVIAVWPSLFLHSMQLIRDPLSNFCMLALFLMLVILLRRELSWKNSLRIAVTSVAIVVVLWLARGNVWNVVIAALSITLVLIAIRMVREHKWLVPNLSVVGVVFAAALLVPTMIESTHTPGTKAATSVIAIPSATNQSSRSMFSRLITQIRARREAFANYENKASNIDGDVRFNDAKDILRYLPRAAVVGFFAPFPRMWFEAGSTGRASRLLSGFETVAMYLLYVPAFFCLWKDRRNLAVWLLTLVAFVGMIALGLVVANAGALYRLRYVFWILMIVIGVRGIRFWIVDSKQKQFEM